MASGVDSSFFSGIIMVWGRPGFDVDDEAGSACRAC